MLLRFVVVLWLLALWAVPLRAESEPEAAPEPPQPDTVGLGQVMDVARSKAEEGLALYAEGAWAEAYQRFTVAHQLFNAPTLQMYMAHCKRELGEWLEARRLYHEVASQAVPEEAPPAFHEAVETSRAERERLEARIPKLRVVIRGMDPALAEATVDGKPVALSPAWVDVDPGEHTVVASGKRAEAVRQTVVVAEGARQTVQIALNPIAPKTVVITEGPAVGLALPLTFAGVGLAGIATGAITGGLVLGKVADLEQRCGGFTCPRALREEREDAKPLATVSTIAFVVGGVGVAAAAVLLPIHLLGGQDTHVSLQVTPGGMTWQARF